jgi:hypothetical protein
MKETVKKQKKMQGAPNSIEEAEEANQTGTASSSPILETCLSLIKPFVTLWHE